MNNNIDFLSIESRYKSLQELKCSNDSKAINQAILDNELAEKLRFYLSEKDKIDSQEKFEKHKKELLKYFDEVYEVITAPGVKKLSDWFERLDVSIKIDNIKLENIKRILIVDYSNLGSQVQSILENTYLLEPSNSIFERIKASIRTNIAKRIQSFEPSKGSLEKELPGFIKELDSMLSGICMINELTYNDIKDFYTTNIHQKNDQEFQPLYDQEVDFYSIVVSKIVESKDWLSTDQTKIKLNDIEQTILEIIKDLKGAISSLKKLNAHTHTDNNLKLIYKKYERYLEFKTGDIIYTRIESDLKEIWTPLIDNYFLINNFFQNYTTQKLNLIESLKKSWEQLTFKGDLEIYNLSIRNLLAVNPINKLSTSDLAELIKLFKNKAQEINKLDEPTVIRKINESFRDWLNKFKKDRFILMSKLKVESTEIVKIEKDLIAIETGLKNISSSKNLLDSLYEDFDGLLQSYEYINRTFKTVLENSELKDDLPYLEGIHLTGNLLNNSEIDRDLPRIKRLLEYDLIKVSIIKNL